MRLFSDFVSGFAPSSQTHLRRTTAALMLALMAGCSNEGSGGGSRTETPTKSESSGQVANAGAKKTEQVNKGKEKETTAATPGTPMPTVWLSPEEVREGWVQLFDGQKPVDKKIFGWTPSPDSDVDWHVTDDGEIEASQGKPGLLLTSVPFADYEFRCEYWIEKNANSGVFLRTVAQPKDPKVDCYELNMWDAAPEFKTASLVGRVKPKKEVTGEEVWKTLHVVCDGNRITAKFDGEEVLDFTDDTPNLCRNGFIGLQKNAGKARFRKIALKPLGTKPLFNGKDLDGWHVVPGGKSKFSVADETIVVKDGRGFLESDTSFADFTLQFEAKTHGDGLNSGVFFRLIPGTEAAPSNGYEFQIQNAIVDGDRAKPKDYGTGAIFNRVKARWVVSNDHEWFTMTLVAHGSHFSGWVNGLQVTDWEDTRKPDPNPRNGKKLEGGPISLQGHDPTTDLQFRNIRAASYPATEGTK